MNKKGFTLIELLAVIVILAVIMVIAVPKILDVIESSRNSAADSSLKLVRSAIKTQVTTATMSSANFTKEGECYLFDFENNNDNADKLSLKNKEKIGGSIKYCNGKFEEDNLTFDGTKVKNYKIVCKRAESLHSETCNQSDSSYYCSSGGYTRGSTIKYGNDPETRKNRVLEAGDAFDCDVDDSGTFDNDERFYYVSDRYNATTKTFESETAVLIYYINVTNGEANTSGSYAYDSEHHQASSSGDNWYGPLTAIKQLPKTKQWSNVSLVSEIRTILAEDSNNKTIGGSLPESFSYSGYAARFLTAQEVAKACNIKILSGTKGLVDSCNYLMENTKYAIPSIPNYGYWLENPQSSTTYRGWGISGAWRTGGLTNTANSSELGVRPAIEVPKNNISY